MHLSLAASAAFVAVVQAFRDTSPFLFFSTSQLPVALQAASIAQIQSSQAVLDATKEFLNSCPTDVYYIIHQPSVLSTDVSQSTTPNLHAALSSSVVKAKYLVSEAKGLGRDVKQELVAHIGKSCEDTLLLDQDSAARTHDELSNQISRSVKDGKKVSVLRTMSQLAGSRKGTERAALLHDLDQSHKSELSAITAEHSYTIIWTTTPLSGDGAEVEEYQPEFQDPAHMELKRDLSEGVFDVRVADDIDPRPLFEKYQFFTPGLFMGLITGIILISILSVALSAISSLQVPYAAFDKEMGPAAQKKQQ
ncbi:hypothetical protein OIDMADRAFT_51791 [Oidiodendron maius Zn]|uniref:Protein BIG1 n=1 Tax=Oidiodendron maius (strain Zn) TaxID=913774 RepID=A0A0C3HNE4_OIDMZ|nr:hypothetical protein OIDMADRAFT_51791 [Oidiodendron maius Zn]